MSMEITGLGPTWTVAPTEAPPQQSAAGAMDAQEVQQAAIAQARRGAEERERQQTDIRSALRELERITQAFNKRLKFTLNEEIDQVVVKIIDAQTDKVIKELPPRELQRVYARIREALGLLFDEEI